MGRGGGVVGEVGVVGGCGVKYGELWGGVRGEVWGLWDGVRYGVVMGGVRVEVWGVMGWCEG